MTEQEEKKNKRTGVIVTVSVHTGILLLFFFLLAWTEPDPPIPSYGVEIDLGFSEEGSDDIQDPAPPSESESTEEPAPEEASEVEPSEAEEVVEETAVVEEVIPEEIVEEAIQDPVVTQTQESPHVVEKEVKKPVEKPVEEPVIKPKETVVEKPKETKPKTEPTSTTKTGASGTDGTSDQAKASNDGDDKDAVGDKGDPKGTDDRANYTGATGGGGGSSLSLTGWSWDSVPKVDDQSDATGRITFEIKIDDEGEILSIKTLQTTVSPVVEQKYRKAVEVLTFSKTSGNSSAAPTATGTITFLIRAN